MFSPLLLPANVIGKFQMNPGQHYARLKSNLKSEEMKRYLADIS